MSMPFLDPAEPEHGQPQAASSEPASDKVSAPHTEVHGAEPRDEASPIEDLSPPPVPRTGWILVALIPHDAAEPPTGLSDILAQAIWTAVSALWHPSILARAVELPRIEPVESPSPPGPRELRIVSAGAGDRLPSGYMTQAEDAGSIVLESQADRAALVRQIQELLGAVGTPETSDDEGMIAAASDFMALGTTRWLLRDLAVAMGHPDAINLPNLAREVLSGADAWQVGDRTTAVNRLRAGFEVLTQARERFYPVDSYVLDLCLLDPALPAGSLVDLLSARVAISLIAPAKAIESQAALDPERVAALRQAISDGWLDVAGGSYSEAEDSVMPLESIFWQFRHGGEVYGANLDNRNVETFARRRFGLHSQVPQFGKRFGYRFALHMAFDGARFPIRPESKRLWESPDGTSLETLTRPPMAADRPSQGLMLPWRLAATMRTDHVATLPLLHWPQPLAGWYLDLRRVASYSPVLARWVTLNDYFHLTDRPYETFRPEPDSYASPYLAQAVARREDEPISRLPRHHRLRATFEGIATLHAFARAIDHVGAEEATESDDASEFAALELALETGESSRVDSTLETQSATWGHALVGKIHAAWPDAAQARRPGYFVLNPLGISRRVAVVLPDAALDLRPEGPLRVAQFTDEGVQAVVDVPPFGFAWVPKEANLEVPPAQPAGLSARGRILKHESIELELDEGTGGIRGIMAPGESTPRLGQQLVMTGLGTKDGKPVVSQMKADRFDLEYGGPALLQAVTAGNMVDPRDGRRIAAFTQRVRLWSGRPILELFITLSDLDPEWCRQAASADPWTHYLACRWAWPDPNSMLRRTVFFAPDITESHRPETPDSFDISTRRQRTSLLFGGLPYHQRNGSRMLDTLLIAGAETGRSFNLGVALELEHPFQAAQDLVSPAVVVPSEDGPPALGARGWLARVDHKAVAVTHLAFAPTIGEERGWGLVVHLLETTGQAARCKLRMFRNPTRARQVDFQGETIIDLSVEGDAVQLDMTPHELARVEITLG